VEDLEVRLWLWTVTDALTQKRRKTLYRMTEAEARERFVDDALKVDGTLEVRAPSNGTNYLGPVKK